jgi:hypothetical protein
MVTGRWWLAAGLWFLVGRCGLPYSKVNAYAD